MNLLKWVNCEVKWCVDVIGIFFNDEVIICFVGVLMFEINDEWVVVRCYMLFEMFGCVIENLIVRLFVVVI